MPLPFLIGVLAGLSSAGTAAVATGAAVAGTVAAGAATAAGVAGATGLAGITAAGATLLGVASSTGGLVATTLTGLASTSLATSVATAISGASGASVTAMIGTVGKATMAALPYAAAKEGNDKLLAMVLSSLITSAYIQKKQLIKQLNDKDAQSLFKEVASGKKNDEIATELENTKFRDAIENMSQNKELMDMLTKSALKELDI